MGENFIIQLLQWLLTKWNDYISPMLIVRTYEGGVLLKWGQLDKKLHKGINWKLPYPFHEAHKCLIKAETLSEEITVTARDGNTLQIQVKAEYEVVDEAKWILDANDAFSNVKDLLGGFAADVCTDHTFEELNRKPVKTEIKNVLNDKLQKYGIKFNYILFSKLAITRSISLSGVGSPKPLEALML